MHTYTPPIAGLARKEIQKLLGYFFTALPVEFVTFSRDKATRFRNKYWKTIQPKHLRDNKQPSIDAIKRVWFPIVSGIYSIGDSTLGLSCALLMDSAWHEECYTLCIEYQMTHDAASDYQLIEAHWFPPTAANQNGYIELGLKVNQPGGNIVGGYTRFELPSDEVLKLHERLWCMLEDNF